MARGREMGELPGSRVAMPNQPSIGDRQKVKVYRLGRRWQEKQEEEDEVRPHQAWDDMQAGGQVHGTHYFEWTINCWHSMDRADASFDINFSEQQGRKPLHLCRSSDEEIGGFVMSQIWQLHPWHSQVTWKSYVHIWFLISLWKPSRVFLLFKRDYKGP